MEEQAGVKTGNRNACRIYCLGVFNADCLDTKERVSNNEVLGKEYDLYAVFFTADF